ncbi:MAG: hypothetical protein RQ757_09790 [Pseudomonadales bacterium]|nr:hypothetical protein [Pseudomonadales bacterium]
MKTILSKFSVTATALAVLGFTSFVSTSLQAQDLPRTPDGKPDLNGIWQTMGTAHWDLEGHASRPGPIVEAGALLAIPGGQGVVEGGRIPYKPEARARKEMLQANWIEEDPLVKCMLPGVPRATYLPYPFQIFLAPDATLITYQFAGADRIVHMDSDTEAQVESWMGHNSGRWEGDTLVIDVSGQVPNTWFDHSGNHHSGWSTHVQERYTMVDANTIQYEATITDPETYTEPWTISMPVYRRREPNLVMLEFKCVEFVEELLYGHLRAPGTN